MAAPLITPNSAVDGNQGTAVGIEAEPWPGLEREGTEARLPSPESTNVSMRGFGDGPDCIPADGIVIVFDPRLAVFPPTCSP